MRSRLASAALGAALIGGTVVVPAALVAPVASAHSVLLEVDPADGATVEKSPEQVTLTFNEEINQSFASVAVTTEGDSGSLVVGDPVVDGSTVSAEVDELDPGPYTVGYRVTSADGHVVSGSSTFTVASAGATSSGATSSGATSGQATAGQTTAPASDTAARDTPDATASDDSSAGFGTALWVVGGLAVLLVGGAIFLLRRGR